MKQNQQSNYVCIDIKKQLKMNFTLFVLNLLNATVDLCYSRYKMNKKVSFLNFRNHETNCKSIID